MNAAVEFFSNMGLGPIFFYPVVITLIVVMAWFAYDETTGIHACAVDGDEKPLQ
jgi:predicted ABC-type sugar transport system permease subunit